MSSQKYAEVNDEVATYHERRGRGRLRHLDVDHVKDLWILWTYFDRLV
jgi:hypothetical protein